MDLGFQSLLLHGIGDYWLQNDWMATNKKKQWFPAVVHAFVYTLPFLLLTRSILALLVIGITHCIIDHTNFVGWLNKVKNQHFTCDFVIFLEQLGNGLGKKTAITMQDGYGNRPVFLRTWLIIIQDNILHLLINYFALLYL